MEEEFVEQNLEDKQNMWKAFNSERTDFWISVMYLLIESLVPGFVILILVGKDFSVSLGDRLPNPKIAYVILINACYLIWTICVTYGIYKLKWHKSDNFTYALTFTSIFITVTLLSFAFNNITVYLLVKFVIVIIVGIACLTAAVFITHILRTHEIRAKAQFLDAFNAWKKGLEFAPKFEKKFVRYEEKLRQDAEHEQELLKIKERVNKKVNAKLIIEAEEEYVKNFYAEKKALENPDKKVKKDDKIKF